MTPSLHDRIRASAAGIFLYGIAPPKQATAPELLDEIASRQLARLQALPIDGLIVYDIQDEAGRNSAPRPFPFLPTLDPETYAYRYMAELDKPKVVYRCVNADDADTFVQWLRRQQTAPVPRASVLVGAPSRRSVHGLKLVDAYALAAALAPDLLLGGVAIAERHSTSGTEHRRMLAKARRGCRFFVTQAVYDVASTKSLLSDYARTAREAGEGLSPVIITLSPCGSIKTLSFMKWLGIAFPAWLEDELRHSTDPLRISIALCEEIFAQLWEFSRKQGIALGVNVESVSVRKDEIDASVELLHRLRKSTVADSAQNQL